MESYDSKQEEKLLIVKMVIAKTYGSSLQN